MANPAEVATCIARLAAAFRYFRPNDDTLALWCEEFAQTNPEHLEAACRAAVRTHKAAGGPAIADIHDILAATRSAATEPIDSPFERFRAGTEGEFDSFPPHERRQIATYLLARGLRLRPTYAECLAAPPWPKDRDQTAPGDWVAEGSSWGQARRTRPAAPRQSRYEPNEDQPWG